MKSRGKAKGGLPREPFFSPFCRVTVTLPDKEPKESPAFNFVSHPLTVGSREGSAVRISRVDDVLFSLFSPKGQKEVTFVTKSVTHSP